MISKGLNIKLTLLEPKFLRENYDDDAIDIKYITPALVK